MPDSHASRFRRYAPRILWYPCLLVLCFLNWYYLPPWGPLLVLAAISVPPLVLMMRWIVKPALIDGKAPGHVFGLKLAHAGWLISLAGILFTLFVIVPLGLGTFPFDYLGYMLIPFGAELVLWAWEAGE